MWKYLFSDFDPRFGTHPDESHMDQDELDDYDPISDTIARGYWDQVLIDEANAAAEQYTIYSSFDSPDPLDPFGSSG